VFKLADSASDRNIVQVFNKSETELYGTFLAIPDHRAKPLGKPSSHSTSAWRTRRRPLKAGSILGRTTATISFIPSRKRLRWPR